MITSLSNTHVKHARSLARKKARLTHRQFLVEGRRVIEEAERAGVVPALLFYDPNASAQDPHTDALLSRLREAAPSHYAVTPAVLNSLAQTETPQGVVAVYDFPQLQIPTSPSFILVLDALRDPGNLGTILRTAWAAGVDLVLSSPGTADVFNPKVVRAAMGAHFFIPISSGDWSEIREILAPIPRVFLADAHADRAFTAVDWSPPCALIIGGEAEGVSAEARELATMDISIPMPGRAESLNAAVAAGILLFEASRARRS